MPYSTSVAEHFVATYNADLAELRSLARVSLPDLDKHPDTLELRWRRQLLDLIPEETEPVVATIACRLNDHGLNEGRRAGEAGARAALRKLIGPASA